MKLVIDRKVWARGNAAYSKLLDRATERRQCCVGIYLSACGLPDEALLGNFYATSLDVRPVLPESAEWLVNDEDRFGHSTDAFELYNTNDNEELSGSERESQIAAIFAKHGVEVEFVG